MCLKCVQSSSVLRQPFLRSVGSDQGGSGSRPAAQATGRRHLDPVRATRIRAMLERVVLAGFGPSLFPNQHPGERVLPPPDQRRGGTKSTFARQVAIYLSHVGCGLSYAQAGSLYLRDRTTAAHACSIVENRRDDPRLDQILALLERCIYAEFRRIDPARAAVEVFQSGTGGTRASVDTANAPSERSADKQG
jgi:hypothetical protein